MTRHRRYPGAAFILLALSACGGWIAEPGEGAELGLDRGAIEPGAVPLGATVTATIGLLSLKRENLVISSISMDPGFPGTAGMNLSVPATGQQATHVNGNLPTGPLTLPPGDTARLKVQLVPTALGEIPSAITILSNDRRFPRTVIPILFTSVKVPQRHDWKFTSAE